MHIDFEMSEQDFMDAQKLALRHLPNNTSKWLFRILPFWGLFLFVAVVWNVVHAGPAWNNGLIMPLVMGLIFLASPFLANQIKRSLFRKNPIFRGARSLVVDDAGLTLNTPTVSIQMKWDSIRNFVEDDSSFVLYQSGILFHFIPKRQLSPEQIAELREAFTRNIAHKEQTA